MDNPDRRVYQWQVTSNGAAHTIRGQMGHTIDQHVGDQVTTTGHYDMHTVGVREGDRQRLGGHGNRHACW